MTSASSWVQWLRDRTMLMCAAVIGVATVWHWIGRADSTINLHSFRQTQTLWTVREFAEGNWSLATPVPILGPPWQIPFELPAFQALAAFVARASGLGAETTARFVGLAFFAISALLLAWLVLQWFGRVASIATTVFFAFSPLANQWATAPLIEFMPVALILAAAALQVRAGNSGGSSRWALVGTSAALALAGAVKITTVFAWLPLILVLIAMSTHSSWRRTLARWLVAVAPLVIVTLAWTRFADSVKSRSPLMESITSSALSTWNFGTLSQRLVVDNYVTVFERFSAMGAPVVIWVAAVVLVGVAYRWSALYVALAAVPILATLTFFNLYVVHDYYLAAVSASVAAVIGAAVGVVAARVPNLRAKSGFVVVSCVFLLAMSFASKDGLRLAEVWRTPADEPLLSAVIAANTQPDDVVLVAGCDWDPTVLYYAQRRGVAIPQWWEGPLPPEIATTVDFFASCADPYVPDPVVRSEFVSDGWELMPIDQGLWKVSIDGE